MPGSTIAPHATHSQPARQSLPPRRAATARVLLVEDDPVTAEVFARALQRNGHEVRIATDGNQALHALRDETPDLIVLDLGLPTVPGVEVLRRLREGDHRDLPVVVVSGASPQSLESARGLVEPGVWLEKPLRPRELVAAVDRFS
ncbi:MAG: response regulator transcription factor [Planctomycetota bacterium]